MDSIITFLSSPAATTVALYMLLACAALLVVRELLRGLWRATQLRRGGDPAPSTMLPDDLAPKPGLTLNLPQQGQTVRRVRATSSTAHDAHQRKAGDFGDMTLGRLAEQLKSDGLDGWTPLPGNRLEYGATGFYIELRPRGVNPFALFSPENQLLSNGNDLQGLKAYGMHQAAYRQQFDEYSQDAAELLQRLRHDR